MNEILTVLKHMKNKIGTCFFCPDMILFLCLLFSDNKDSEASYSLIGVYFPLFYILFFYICHDLEDLDGSCVFCACSGDF